MGWIVEDIIDLYGLFVEEVEDIFEVRICDVQVCGQFYLYVIVGKGNYLIGGV